MTFTKSLEQWLSTLDYVGEIDIATLTATRRAAEELDNEFRTTLLTEYRRWLKEIKALAPVAEQEDALDPLLSPLEA